MSVKGMAEGFVWGAVIGGVLQWIGLRNIMIGLAVCGVGGYIIHLSEEHGVEAAAANKATVEIVRFNTSDPYAPSLVAHVVNPSSETLDSFSVSCANIDFRSEQSINPRHEALIEVGFVNQRFYSGDKIDPMNFTGSVPCTFRDSNFE